MKIKIYIEAPGGQLAMAQALASAALSVRGAKPLSLKISGKPSAYGDQAAQHLVQIDQ